jgi:hypothetical protein
MAETPTMQDLMDFIQQPQLNLQHAIQRHVNETTERMEDRLRIKIDKIDERIDTLETRSRKSSSRSRDSKKSLVSKNPRVPVSASFSSTPISVSQVPVTPVRTTPTSISWLPSTPVVAPVSPAFKSKPNPVLPESSSIDDMVRWQFEICLLDILCWPDFDLVSLRKIPAKDPFTPTSVAPVAKIHDIEEIGDSDSEYSEPEDFPFHTPAVELFPEDQVQELNFIVEGCVFRGDIEIPTPPPSDSEQDDSRAPWERKDLPELDYDGYQAQWKRDEVNGSNRKLADEPRYREPSPQPVRFIPSAAFTRSRGEERSNTTPDEFDRYLAESFRSVTKPLLPATPTPVRDVAAPKAATTGAAITSHAGPSADIVPRRLSYSDVSTICRSHGERDPDLGVVSDEDSRCDDDYGVDPNEWQDQSLYDAELLQHIEASYSPCSSPGDRDSFASSGCDPQSNRDDYSDSSSVQSDRPDSDYRSEVSADGYNEYGDY